jgi:alkyl hydroperoxide reductase subunit AhpC
MSLQLGDTAPDFMAQTTEGTITFHDWIKDHWCVLFSHPRDFTPVCTTELGEVARLQPEFGRRRAVVIALSVDPLQDHEGWVRDIELTQHCKINYPLIADPERRIARLYGMIHPNASDTFTVRSVFLIDPAKKIRLIMTYPDSTGRNFQEILRALDALKITDRYRVETPVNWKEGEEVIISPDIQDKAQLRKYFPKGYREVTPYLRYAPAPRELGEVKSSVVTNVP